MTDNTTTTNVLIGGRFNMLHVELSRTPKRIEVDGVLYDRIDDPDTGEPLGGYAVERQQIHARGAKS